MVTSLPSVPDPNVYTTHGNFSYVVHWVSLIHKLQISFEQIAHRILSFPSTQTMLGQSICNATEYHTGPVDPPPPVHFSCQEGSASGHNLFSLLLSTDIPISWLQQSFLSL